MANNRIQVKRTSTTGRTPNTTNAANTQYIAAGELALNMTDGILYTSDGSALIEIGANNSYSKVGNTLISNTSVQSNNITALGGVIRSGSDAANNTIANSSVSAGSTAQRAFNLIGTDSVVKIARQNNPPSVEMQYWTAGTLTKYYDFYVSSAGLFSIRDRSDADSDRLNISSTGNVGISNTTPAHKLSVQGDISLSGGIHANGTLGTSGQVLTSNGTSVYWATSSGGTASFDYGLSYAFKTQPF